MSQELLAGKIALITGAANGIGRAAASVFASYGAKLLLADLDVDGGEAAAKAVREAGGEALFVRADVSVDDDVAALVTSAVQQWGRLDCAFNNAGIDGQVGPTADCSRENWDRVIAVNLTGVFLCMQHELRQMLGQGGGAIVNVASVAGVAGFPGLPAYVAAKHGVVGLSKAAALEYAGKGIRINSLCPGAIRTAMIDDAIRQGFATEAQLIGSEPIGRMGEPREIAEAAAWMCSDRASFMLGATVVVDGGMVAG